MNTININDFDYSLPQEKIAVFPLQNRDESKLLVYKNNTISQESFKIIPQLIPKDSLIVFNNTKVIKARLEFRKKTGAAIEIFLLEPYSPKDYLQAFSTNLSCKWKCLIGNAKKWKNEALLKEITINRTKLLLNAEKLDNNIVSFSWDNNNICFSEIVQEAGNIPIPPYLNRKSEEIDKSRYQTLLAKNEGSVAAPTAALHFTNETLDKLIQKNINIEELTLHVGAGTFRPVLTNSIINHQMHKERIFLTEKNIVSFLKFCGNITAVGTTTVRTMESLYWLGVKLIQNEKINLQSFSIEQWEVYNLPTNIPVNQSLERIIEEMKKQGINQISGETGIIIVPGYGFKMIDRLITNFHQPKSTLLLLIAAFVGNNWKNIYTFALDNNFRFLSYGDSSFLTKTG
ncbi:MAG: S-adenosylmethionine:tRNA ribosyltransferase-isomerase [Bacteroidales bacterium]|nr:S-adenosylmethionine:tRNA ribosyltransferase-isomerase [Bacteroidales bacterium]